LVHFFLTKVLYLLSIKDELGHILGNFKGHWVIFSKKHPVTLLKGDPGGATHGSSHQPQKQKVMGSNARPTAAEKVRNTLGGGS
jgi:hypothetical protein